MNEETEEMEDEKTMKTAAEAEPSVTLDVPRVAEADKNKPSTQGKKGYTIQPESNPARAIKELIRYRDCPGELARRSAPAEVQEKRLEYRRERMKSGGTSQTEEDEIRAGQALERGKVRAKVVHSPAGYLYMIDYDGILLFTPVPEELDAETQEARNALIARDAGSGEKNFFAERLFDFILRRIHKQWLDNDMKYISPLEFTLEDAVSCHLCASKNNAMRDISGGLQILETIAIGGRVIEGGKPHELIRGNRTREESPDFVQNVQEEEEARLKSMKTRFLYLLTWTYENGKFKINYDTNIEWWLIDRYTMPVPNFVYGLETRGAYSVALWAFYIVRVNARYRVFTDPHEVRIGLKDFHKFMRLPSLASKEIAENYEGEKKIKTPIRTVIKEMAEEAAEDKDVTFRYEFEDGGGALVETAPGNDVNGGKKFSIEDWLNRGFLVVHVNEGEYMKELKRTAGEDKKTWTYKTKKHAEITEEAGA